MKFTLGGGKKEPDKRAEQPGKLETTTGASQGEAKPTYSVAKTSDARPPPASPVVDDGKPRYGPDFMYVEGKLPTGEYKVRFITGPSALIDRSTTLSEFQLRLISEATSAWKDDARVKTHGRYAEFQQHPKQMMGYYPLLLKALKSSS